MTTKKTVEVETVKSTWEVLSKIDCSAHTEQKNWLTYLSWAWAWGIVKKHYPTASYEVVRYDDSKPYLYDETLWYMVTTQVTIEWETIEMNLPVMDSKNKAMKSASYTYDTKWSKWNVVEWATMFDINTAIMRCLTKNLAMFGLWHYIYAWEDLPEDSKVEDNKTETKEQPKEKAITKTETKEDVTKLSETQLQTIRDFRTEFKETLNDEAFLLIVTTITPKIKELKDIPNLTKIEASQVLRKLAEIGANEVANWRKIDNVKLRVLSEKIAEQNLATKK